LDAVTAELTNLVGLYCLVSVILNGFDAQYPRQPGPDGSP
jgi:hypothetical protein